MKKCVSLFIIVFGFISSLFGQQIPKVLKALLQTKGPVPIVVMRSDSSGFANVLCKNEPGVNQQQPGRTLLKSATGVFVSINGTGRLYQLVDSAGQMVYKRIDSTTYSGYSFGALVFTFRNNLYSLGGYGFWRANGHLRNFRFKVGDWEPMPLSEEVPLSHGINHFPWIDEKNHALFMLSFPSDFINQGVSNWQEKAEQQYKPTVRKLNLVDGTWYEVGQSANDNSWKYKVLANTPWGLLIESGYRKLHLFDYRSNSVKTLSKTKADSINQIFAGLNGICFFSDSTFVYGDLYKNSIDSLHLSYSDFHGNDVHIWKSISIWQSWSPMFSVIPSLVLLSLMGGTAWFFLKKRRKHSGLPLQAPKEKIAQENIALPANETPISDTESDELFSEIEKRLIRQMIENTRNGKSTSVLEINRLLGVANKNIPSQKRIRSEAINGINSKIKSLVHTDLEFIKRNRTALDKRSIEYFVSPDLEYVVAAFLNDRITNKKRQEV